MTNELKSIPEGAIKLLEVIRGYATDSCYDYIDDSNSITTESLWLTLDNKYVYVSIYGDAFYEDPKELNNTVEWIEHISKLDHDYYRCHEEIDNILDLKTAIESGKPSQVEINREYQREYQGLLAKSTKLLDFISVRNNGDEDRGTLYVTDDGKYILDGWDELVDWDPRDLLGYIDDILTGKPEHCDKYECYNNTNVLALRQQIITRIDEISIKTIPPNAVKLIKARWGGGDTGLKESDEILWRTSDGKYLLDDGSEITELSPEDVLKLIKSITKPNTSWQYYKCYKKTNIDKLQKELMESINAK